MPGDTQLPTVEYHADRTTVRLELYLRSGLMPGRHDRSASRSPGIAYALQHHRAERRRDSSLLRNRNALLSANCRSNTIGESHQRLHREGQDTRTAVLAVYESGSIWCVDRDEEGRDSRRPCESPPTIGPTRLWSAVQRIANESDSAGLGREGTM